MIRSVVTSLIIFIQVGMFAINMRDIIIYVTRLWEKYLLKRSLIKLLLFITCNIMSTEQASENKTLCQSIINCTHLHLWREIFRTVAHAQPALFSEEMTTL